uniref:G-protein coupled receptors family 2 profile 2 domain-containing protein n=1 Tax=Ciona savignyi TaxID=51511 RepID=H2Z6A9_CIOSA
MVTCTCKKGNTVTIITRIKKRKALLSTNFIARLCSTIVESIGFLATATTAILLAILIRKSKSMRISSVQPTRLGLLSSFCGFYLSLIASGTISAHHGSKPICQSAAFFVHFFLLGTFVWVSLEATVLFYFVVRNSFKTKIFSNITLNLIGWGIPLIIATSTIIVGTYKGNYTNVYHDYVIEMKENEIIIEGGIYHSQCYVNQSDAISWAVVL